MTANDAARACVLEMRAIEKNFGGVKALRGANLSAMRGEILGLCGENGAGKSTILKVLSGVYPHGTYAGEIIVEGAVQKLAGTSDARAAGIAIVHQELMLVPELSVAANLFLGREPGSMGAFGVVDDCALEAEAKKMLARFGCEDLDANVAVGRLGIGMQQIVEIVRALSYDAKILVLDEPTAALTASECDRLTAWLRDLRAKGTTSIYVSHRMDEVFALCDRVTVLRDGQTVGTMVVGDITPRDVIAAMVGREVTLGRASEAPPVIDGEAAALDVIDLSVRLPGMRAQIEDAHDHALETRNYAVERVSLRVRRGEIVAVCGAMGSGRTALLSTLFGCAEGAVSGTIRVNGAPANFDSPIDAIAHDVALLPEDRKKLGIVPEMTVRENLALPSLASRALSRLGVIDDIAEAQLAERRISELRIRGAADALVNTLSGGNQQKVVLGKWLEHPPKVLLLDEPTRGVDVGAREEIYGILAELASRGVAILFASSDLVEVIRLAHRVLVLRHGRVVGEIAGADATQEAIVALSTGASSIAPSTSRDSHASPSSRAAAHRHESRVEPCLP